MRFQSIQMNVVKELYLEKSNTTQYESINQLQQLDFNRTTRYTHINYTSLKKYT